jgi:hypothetical protein
MTINSVSWLPLFLVAYCTDKVEKGLVFKHRMTGLNNVKYFIISIYYINSES